MADILADDILSDDRRRAVNFGQSRGRDAVAANLHRALDLGDEIDISPPIATRGRRLVLNRLRWSANNLGPEAFPSEALFITEVNSDERIAASLMFDFDDFDSAIEELDARFLAGEAAGNAKTWSVIALGYASLNRGVIPQTTQDWAHIDHRLRATLGARDLTPYLRTAWELTPDLSIWVEEVHRLDDLGAVVTHASRGTSREGFAAEWQMIELLTVDGDLINRSELFDEADLDAALARFEELQPQTRRLENAASRASDRLVVYFAARDWEAAAETLADNFCSDDRRHVVNAGLRHGRDLAIANMQKSADLQMMFGRHDVIATRGERLVLSRARWSGPDQGPEAFYTEILHLVEVDADERVASRVMFDANDIDAAFEEFDARYLAGEAAAHSHTWSVVTGTYTAVNRSQLPRMTPDFAFVDHLPLQRIETGDLTATIRAMRDLTPDISQHIEAVHRLSDLGAVVTRMASGTSQEGFDAEWRQIDLFTVQGDKVSRCEVFADADIDAALARFEELQPQAPPLENTASRVYERYQSHFAARDWAGMAELLTGDTYVIDHRRVVNSGVRRGRDLEIANMQAVASVGAENITSKVVATRGVRLALCRTCIWGQGQPEAFRIEFFSVVEINTDERIVARVAFDPEDIDAAFEELDARYLAGEAAAHARTWSVIAREYAAFNWHELPAADYVTVDHRHLPIIDATDPHAAIHAVWDVTPDFRIHIEAVHRLSSLGALATYTAHGTSTQGFDAEWRMILLLTVEGDLINRCEVFDETDLDAALARFDELDRPAPRLENVATRTWARQVDAFNRRDVEEFLALVTVEGRVEDRRKGLRALFEGPALRSAAQAMFEAPGGWRLDIEPIAVRGTLHALTRTCWRDTSKADQPITIELLALTEIGDVGLIHDTVSFDPDDTNAAFEELDARYLSGEAAAHSHTWSVISGAYATLNRHELPATAPDWVNIDHRLLATVEAGDLPAYLHAAWDVMPELSIYVAAVHRLSDLGAVVTHATHGTSREGVQVEWRMIELLTVEGDLLNRSELFDETDLDAALARFEELHPEARRLENATSRAVDRFLAYFAARNWAALAEILAQNCCIDDRRRVVNAGFWDGRDVVIANMRALDEAGANITRTVIATRGERLALTRIRSSNRDPRHGEFVVEMLGIGEINSDERFTAHILFDTDDIDAAFEELDARYLAGEAAAHSHTWSVIAGAHAGFNRHEFAAMTTDSVYIDHRPGVTTEPTDLRAYMRAVWDITPDASIQIDAVHRLSDIGAVVTHTARGISPEGFSADWRMIGIFTADGDLMSRCEIFDEAELDAALARFEELHAPTRRLENAASQLVERYTTCFSAREWTAMAELLVDDIVVDDRRRVVNAGVRLGRDVHIADTRVGVEVGAENMTSSVIATRGQRLALVRVRTSNRGSLPDEVGAEMVGIAEIDANNRIAGLVAFDVEDVNAAFEELDARHLAGEGAAHAHTWSVIAGLYAGFNRHQRPATTPDWNFIDHRRIVNIEPSDLSAAIEALWEQTSDISIYMEAVHRLSDRGVVVTNTARGVSHEDFDAEWRSVNVFTVDGDMISGCEMFDEADLDAALARFDELDRPTAP